MAVFAITAQGKSGADLAIYLECNTYAECQKIIDDLGLKVKPHNFGRLINRVNTTMEELMYAAKGGEVEH